MLYVTIYESYIDLLIAAYHLGSFDTGHTWRRPWVASWHAAYYALCGIQERHASFVSYIECNPSCSDHACWKHIIFTLFDMVCFQNVCVNVVWITNQIPWQSVEFDYISILYIYRRASHISYTGTISNYTLHGWLITSHSLVWRMTTSNYDAGADISMIA